MLVHMTTMSTAVASSLHRSLPLSSAKPAASGTGGSSRELAFAALGSWIAAEALGAYMLRNWFARGGPRQPVRPERERMPVPFLLGHAGMAATGFLCWVTFMATSAVALAWLALAFLVPAIGFGVSTVTVWTPYPGHRRGQGHDLPGNWSADADPSRGPMVHPLGTYGGNRPEQRAGASVIPDAHVRRALEDEGLTSKLVDDLIASNIAGDLTSQRRPFLDPRTIIPLAHGVLAITTFLLVTLAAIAAQ